MKNHKLKLFSWGNLYQTTRISPKVRYKQVSSMKLSYFLEIFPPTIVYAGFLNTMGLSCIGMKTVKNHERMELSWANRGVADQGVNGMWNIMKDIIVQVAVKVCGRGRTGEPKGREEWWWNDEAQEVVKEKNIAFKEANNERGDVEAENRYNEAKKKAKNRARDETSTDWYKELETKEGQQKFFG